MSVRYTEQERRAALVTLRETADFVADFVEANYELDGDPAEFGRRLAAAMPPELLLRLRLHLPIIKAIREDKKHEH